MTITGTRSRPKLHLRWLAIAAVIGAVFGSAWDLLHVRTHTTIYSIGTGRMPLWVPLEFALVYAAGVAGVILTGSPVSDARSRHRLLGETAWVTIVYAITAFGHHYEVVVAAVAALALLSRRRTLQKVLRANPIPAAALVVCGSVVETVLIAAGVFHYTHASLGNVPLWLPLLYANAVPFAVRLTEAAMNTSER